MGQHGPGARGAPARPNLLALPRDAGPDGGSRSRRLLHALPSGASRAGSFGRGDRLAAVDRLRPGREPPARREGSPVAAARGRLSSRGQAGKAETEGGSPGLLIAIAAILR